LTGPLLPRGRLNTLEKVSTKQARGIRKRKADTRVLGFAVSWAESPRGSKVFLGGLGHLRLPRVVRLVSSTGGVDPSIVV